MILNNPWGLLALLGIPVVLLIHFLQRQAQIVPASTLFLLEKTQQESSAGRRFERLRQSIPLWLQLLTVLLLAWLLAEPRYRTQASTQQIAIVIDSSASMSVFQDEVVSTLKEELPRLQGAASELQLYLLSSEPDEPLLYTGAKLEDALAVLRDWQPTASARDPRAALRLARSRIRSQGILIYVTDHVSEQSLPFEAQLLAVGEPIDNLGFTGLSFAEESDSWQATVRNYSDKDATRSWHVVFPDGSQSEKQELSLASDGITTLTGNFPEGVGSLTVHLEGDSFTLDDLLPIVQSQPKLLVAESLLPAKFSDFERRFLSFFPSLEKDSTSAPDLTLTSYDPLFPILPEHHAIITIDETARSRTFLTGRIIAETHPLTRGLNWQALQARETTAFPITESDEVLLWQGDRPLIALRNTFSADAEESTQNRQHLIFNFDLSLSNALKLPSTVVLLHRFTSGLRESKIAFEALNTETNQPIELAHSPSPQLFFKRPNSNGELISQPLESNEPLRAPGLPGYFEIAQGEATLMRSASHFADTREADFRQAGKANKLGSIASSAIERHTSEDRWWSIWVLLTLAILILTWHFANSRKTSNSSPALAN